MERNANYALVGLISTILLIAMIVFVFWLTNFELSQKYDLYDVVFHGPVHGLTKGGEVQFNGIKVGEVSNITLDQKDPNIVIARVRVTEETPVRVDSRAQLEPQGITGVNYVQISAGTPSRPLLEDTVEPGAIPQIAARRDQISDLLSGGGTVMQDAVETLGRINRVLSDTNIKNFSAILSDVQAFTAELRERKAILADAQKTLQSANDAAIGIRNLANSTQTLVASDGKRTIVKLGDAATEIQGTAADLRALIAKLKDPAADFAAKGLPQLTSTLSSLQTTSEDLDRLVGEIEQNPRGLIGKAPARDVEVKP
jgi:phospholipid/cholesterol/gamma-HCH transport system substrate-binding protein